MVAILEENEQCCAITLRSGTELKNKNKEKEVIEEILLKKYDVIEEESNVNSKDGVKKNKEVSFARRSCGR